jgi:hypothetical protein
MMTTIAFAVGLLAVTADVAPGTIEPRNAGYTRHEVIQAPPPAGGSKTTADQSGSGQGECMECNNGCCGKHRCRFRSTCDMLPHYAYISDWDFYYYFRPYNYIHIRPQQETVTRWGGDVRNPYANEMFEKVYEGLEDSVRAGAKKAEPMTPIPVSDRRKTQARTRLGAVSGFSK